MLKFPPHEYGPKSLLAFAARQHMLLYRDEAKHARANGRPLARRACIEVALSIRADFRAARKENV